MNSDTIIIIIITIQIDFGRWKERLLVPVVKCHVV